MVLIVHGRPQERSVRENREMNTTYLPRGTHKAICICGNPDTISVPAACPSCGRNYTTIERSYVTVVPLPTAPQVITALLEALERADIILDQLDRDIDVVACLCQMNEAKRMAEDWENRE